MKKNYNRKGIFLFIFSLIWISFPQKSYSQITISTPTINFSQACASSSFNNYNFSFSFSPIQSLGAGNQFIVELSDAVGSFASPTIVQTLTNTTSPVSGSFSLPTTTSGSAYRIRIRSTNPVKISNPSNAFSAHYAIHNTPFSINGNVGTVNLCGEGSYILEIDDTGTPASPTYYPFLIYKWYKNFIPIPGETGSSIEVTTPGSYYVIVDYGACVMNSYSNIVQIQVAPDITPEIEAQNGSLVICPNSSTTLTSVLQNSNYTYTWYRNNAALANSNSPTFNAMEEGVYHLVITNQGCPFESNSLFLEVTDFDLSLSETSEVVLIPGETIVISSTTDAVSPTYQWFRDDIALNGATQSSLSVTQDGVYKLEVSQTSPCAIVKEESVTVVYPLDFDLNIALPTSYQNCVSQNTLLSIDGFDALTTNNIISILGNSYNYSYQWLKDGVAVNGATATTLAIASALQNGNYSLQVTIPDFGIITSNVIPVNLAPTAVTISNSTLLCEGSDVLLTSSITDSGYNYQWFKNGNVLPGATASTLTVSEEGGYYIEIAIGNCSSQSNTIQLDYQEFTIFTSTPDFDIILPGENKILAITTDAVLPAYSWYKDNALLNGQTQNTLTVSQPGTYKVIVTQNQGCIATAEKVFVLEYPTGFGLEISAASDYASCVSNETSLAVNNFSAFTTIGTIDLTGLPNSYTYQWLLNGNPVAGATSSTLNVSSATQNGNYSLSISIPDFAPVVSNSVAINLKPETPAISNQGALCEGSTVLLTSSVTSPEYDYQWYFNAVAIPGADSNSVTVSEEGSYHLVLTSGPCESISNTISLEFATINISSTSPDFDIILPGENKTLAITTDAVLPTYSWYKDSVLLNGQTQNTLTVSQPGTYKVIVTQNQGCIATAEKVFVLEYPTEFGLEISAASDYASCVSNETSLSVSNFSAFTTIGTIDLTGLPNSYTYQWLLNGNPVAGATSSTLNVSSATQNGNYSLSISIPDFAPVVSNSVAINLKPETPAISNQGALCEGSTVLLLSSVTSPEYDYQWYFNAVAIPGADSNSVTVSEEGSYHLVLTSGPCESISNTISLEFATINISSTSPDFDIILPGENKTLAITTDAVLPAYSWYKDSVLLNGQTQNTLAVSQPGTYKAVVTQDQGCIATAEKIFILEYPTGFGLEISAASDYASCVSNETSLAVNNFSAFTTIGTIDLTGLPNSYTYQWLLNGNPVAGATSSTLNVSSATQNGNYSLSISIPDFAPVVSNSVAINLKPETPSISSQGILCEGSTVLLLSSVTSPEYNYQWYFNAIAIPGATSSTVTVSEEGSYHLAITSGPCESISNTIDLQFATINVSSASPDHDVILPGETKTLVVSTDAVLPVYSWYKDDVLINGETQNTLTVDQPGTYKAVIVQNQGCVAIVEKIFILEAPTGFSLEIDINSDYNQCTSETITLAITNFIAYTTLGSVTISDVQNTAYSYQWFKGGQPVSGATASSITLNNESQNGNYELQVAVAGFTPIVSNIETVDLIFSDPLSLTVTGNLCDSSNPAILTSNIENPSYTYIWHKEGIAIATNNASSYSTTETGNYYVVINTGNCIFSSNTVTVEAADFALTSTNPDLDVIIPGEVKTLSITTDALQPTIVWYRNDVQISNANSSSFSVNLDGEYKVIVTQTQDCVVAKEKIFEMEYPSQFDLVIDHAGNYQECGSTATELEVTDFTATTLNGLVDLSSNPYNYTYQWLKNNQPIPGATSPTLTLDEIADNGTYTLNVYVTNVLVLSSNPKEVTLGFVDSATISTTDVYCNSGTPITITSDVNNPEYTYEWYKSGATAVIGNNSSITVTETGSYYLVVSYLSCTVTSNVLEILPFDIEQLIVDADSEILLQEGTEIIITASGAQNYAWYLDTTLLSQTPSLSITEPGHYTLIASVGGCEATRHFNVTLKPNNILAIPNVITPNGDGINDTWAIPLKYVNDPNVEIVIYGPDGTIVFRASSYMNNWPESDFTYSKKNPVYYYTIMENYKITKRGSITIIK